VACRLTTSGSYDKYAETVIFLLFYMCNSVTYQGCFNQLAKWARAQVPRIFLIEGLLNGCGWSKFLKTNYVIYVVQILKIVPQSQ